MCADRGEYRKNSGMRTAFVLKKRLVPVARTLRLPTRIELLEMINSARAFKLVFPFRLTSRRALIWTCFAARQINFFLIIQFLTRVDQKKGGTNSSVRYVPLNSILHHKSRKRK